jgi:hypothetical protein
MSDTLLNSLTSRFLLRDAETRARRFGDVERRDFAVQLSLTRQKLDSAQVLWAHQQYVEALGLAEESVNAALRSAELCLNVVPAGGEDGSGDALWEQVLRALGFRSEHIQDARLCQAGLPEPRPVLNAQITPRERAYFQKAIEVSHQVVERLRQEARTPRDIVWSRWGRVAMLAAGVLAVVGLGAATVRLVRADKKQEAHLRDRSMQDGFLFREDGSPAVFVVQGGTRYLIPNAKEFSALGYQWPSVELVSPGAMSHLRDKPPDRALLKERGGSTVYLIEGGAKRAVISEDVFKRRGFKWNEVKTIPAGALAGLAVGKPVE